MQITGTVFYLERMAMPPTAQVRVALLTATAAGVSPRVLAESIETMGERQVPIPFVLAVPPGTNDEQTARALQAEISVDGVVQFQTPDALPLPAGGAPLDSIEIRVHRNA